LRLHEGLSLEDGDGSGAETETATVATLSNVVFEAPHANQVSHLSTDGLTRGQSEKAVNDRLNRVSYIQFQTNQISHGDEKPQIPGSTTANVVVQVSIHDKSPEGTKLGSTSGTLFRLSTLALEIAC